MRSRTSHQHSKTSTYAVRWCNMDWTWSQLVLAVGGVEGSTSRVVSQLLQQSAVTGRQFHPKRRNAERRAVGGARGRFAPNGRDNIGGRVFRFRLCTVQYEPTTGHGKALRRAVQRRRAGFPLVAPSYDEGEEWQTATRCGGRGWRSDQNGEVSPPCASIVCVDWLR